MGAGFGGTETHLFSNASAQCGTSFLAFFLLDDTGGVGGCVRGLREGERPEEAKWRKKTRTRGREVTHLGPQRLPFGAHEEKRDMFAMSVKRAGRSARVHVVVTRGVSLARERNDEHRLFFVRVK